MSQHSYQSPIKQEMSYQGILRPLSQGRKSRFHFAVYDIECPSKESLEFYCCGFFDGERYCNFRSMNDFLCHVLTKQYSGWRFFAHFGGRFDVHYVYDWIRANEPDTYMEINCSGSCVISLTVRHGKNRWRFVDSYRLMPASLATLTHEFDVKHKKLAGGDFKNLQYNEHDCRGLWEVLEIFFDQFSICSETIASHAMRVFRSKFMYKDIYQPHQDVESFVRESYVGGRCEIYRYDCAYLNHYDINSLYPAAMCDPVPIEYLFQSRDLPDDDSKRIGFYRARINQPDCYLPVLPVRIEKLYFPIGYFEGVFTSMELRKAIEQGARVSIMEGRVFHAEPLMQEFAASLFELKKQAEIEGNNGKRYVTKIVMNSLYGKWGQRREQRSFFTDDGREGAFPLPNGIAYEFTESRAAHIMPHISSCITSRARLIIYDYLKKAKSWYTDTDSLFTNFEIPISSNLGGMKLEGSGIFEAYRLKEYRFNEEYKIKGLPRSKNESVELRKAEDFDLQRRYLAGEKILTERMKGWTESIRHGQPTVQRIERTRQFQNVKEKRCRIGFDSRPWNMLELTM